MIQLLTVSAVLFGGLALSVASYVGAFRATGTEAEGADTRAFHLHISGLASDVNRVLPLSHGSVVIPPDAGITWRFGDVPCGRGLQVILPHQTRVCFDDYSETVKVSDLSSLDGPALGQILDGEAGYRFVR